VNWSLVGTVVFGIVALITSGVAIWLGFKQLMLAKKPQPVWSYMSAQIIGLGGTAIEGLELRFRGKPISEVHQTVFIFYSKGKGVIRSEDVVNRPTILFKGAEILRDPHLFANRDVTQFKVGRATTSDGDCLELDFSFLEQDDGVIVEVLHTGYESITCSGYIMGTEKRGIDEVRPFFPFMPTDSPLDRKFSTFRRLSAVLLVLGTACVALAYVSFGTVGFSIVSALTLFAFGYIIWSNIEVYRTVQRFRRFPVWTSAGVPWHAIYSMAERKVRSRKL